jgi:ethanolamine kinase
MAAVEKNANGLKWKHLPLVIDPDNYIDSFKTHIVPMSLPQWEGKELIFKDIVGGLTNKLVAVYPEELSLDDCVLLRFSGCGTEHFINRELEIAYIITLNNSGLAQPLHCEFSNGLCYGFFPGRNITLDEMKDMNVARHTAKMLAKLHHVKMAPSLHVNIKTRLHDFQKWLDRIPQSYDDSEVQLKFEELYGANVDSLKAELIEMTKELDKLDQCVVFCHNDLLSGNVIYNEKDEKVEFIDFEFAGPNHRAYDIGNHFCEFAGLDVQNMDYSRYPSVVLQKKWLMIYLRESAICEGKSPDGVTDAEVHQLYREVNKFALVSCTNNNVLIQTCRHL